MTDQNTFDYKIAMVAPSRVGKTSLITAILEESQKTLLAGTNIIMEPMPGKTETRINRYKSQLRSTLKTGNEFTPEIVEGSEEDFTYFLEMKVIRKQKFGRVLPGKKKLQLGILDYPGGWMEEDATLEQQAKWETCKEWMHESAILIIPIESPILMESSVEESFYASQKLLTNNIASIAQVWAKYRCEAQDPGLLILAPVKCEDCFNDNGGIRQDKAEELFSKVIHEYYDIVIRKVQQEISQSDLIKIEYHPVDTIGSIELMKAKWVDDGCGKKYLDAQYMVRSHIKKVDLFQPYGADAVLQSICKHIIGQEQDKKRGIVASFLRWATGENKEIREALEKISKASVKSNRKRIID